MKFGQLRGYVFEILVMKLVINSGYHLIENIEPNKMKIKKGSRFLEYKGRGGYHQIDIPVDSNYNPEFIYPIRLLAEVKSLDTHVTKSIVRERIGVMMDIQQNYTDSDYLDENIRKNRKTEVFALFSAKGFNLEAEELAFAHNIKTISFEGNTDIEYLNDIANNLAKNYENSPTDIQNEMLNNLYDAIILGNVNLKNNTAHKFERIIQIMNSYKTSIIGTTSSGLTMFFNSKEEFPFEKVFNERDSVICKIRSNDEIHWYLEVEETDVRLNFSMPKMALETRQVINNNVLYPKKEDFFEEIYFKYKVCGIIRDLSFKFDKVWFRQFLK